MAERSMAAIMGAALLAAEQRLTVTAKEGERARRWLGAALERMRVPDDRPSASGTQPAIPAADGGEHERSPEPGDAPSPREHPHASPHPANALDLLPAPRPPDVDPRVRSALHLLARACEHCGADGVARAVASHIDPPTDDDLPEF